MLNDSLEKAKNKYYLKDTINTMGNCSYFISEHDTPLEDSHKCKKNARSVSN